MTTNRNPKSTRNSTGSPNTQAPPIPRSYEPYYPSVAQSKLTLKTKNSSAVGRQSSTKTFAKRKPKGFHMSGYSRESHGNPLYCVAWSTDVFCDEDEAPTTPTSVVVEENEHHPAASAKRRYFATCGGNHVTIYEVQVSSGENDKKETVNDGLTLRQAYVDPDKDEKYFSCVFGGRSVGTLFGYAPNNHDHGSSSIVLGNEVSEKKSGEKRTHDERVPMTDQMRMELLRAMANLQTFDGPQLLCVAGERGSIKIIDTVRRMLLCTLTGHGREVNDMKVSPVDEWLLLSASKDESIRLWNVKTTTCVAIFCGHEGHRDSVLAVGWHPSGCQFVSGGMDTTIKIWNIGEGTQVQDALQRSKSVKLQTWDADSAPSMKTFRTVVEQTPSFTARKVHADYVDCVRFVGDLVLSKSINNTVVLWKPDLAKFLHHTVQNEFMVLREFSMNKCDVWFVRFDTDVNNRMLAVGNTVGLIKIWEIDGNPNKKPFARLDVQYCTSLVRMVAFCPDSNCLVATCDDATVWKWDAF